MSVQEDWDDVRSRWRRLERKALSPEQVFDKPAQGRIGNTIATEAARAPQRVVKLKLARRTESYYLLQAADAQDRAQRARSSSDREKWLDLADKWLELLKRMKAARRR